MAVTVETLRLVHWRPAESSVLRHPDFLKLWAGQTISQLGSQVTNLALPLVAVLLLRATAMQVAWLAALQSLPCVLIGLPAGVWVDRFRRRPILIAVEFLRAAMLASIPVAALQGSLSLPHVYVVGSVNGLLAVFFEVAYAAYLPSLLDRAQLPEGSARLEMTRSGAHVAGPSLAGGLFRLVTAPMALAVDALSYVGSACLLLTIRSREPALTDPAARPRMAVQIREGLEFVLRHPLLRPLAMTTCVWNVTIAMAGSVALVYVVRSLGITAGLLGIVYAIGNAGFVVGAVWAGRLSRRFGIGPTMLGSILLSGLPLVALSLAPRGPGALPLLVAGGLVASFASVVFGTNQVSLRQAMTPVGFEARMTATMRFVAFGAVPMGSLLGGVLASTLGVRETLLLVAFLGSVSFLPLARSPVRHLKTIPAAPHLATACRAVAPD